MLTRRLRIAVPLLLSLAVSAAAQEVPPASAPRAASLPAGPVVIFPAAAGTQPSTQPATQAAAIPIVPFTTTRPATTLTTRVKFNFQDASIDSILEYLASSFGFIVIKDQGVRITGRVTVRSPTDVTADEAIEALDSVLKTQGPGYGIMRSDKVLHVMERSAIKPKTEVFIGSDPKEIKPSDTLRTQVIPLYTVDAVRARQDLSSMFSAEAEVSANASSNTLVITDSATNIRRIVEILSAMDRQGGTATALQVFKLQYANASTTAKLITDIFSGSATGTTGGGQGNTRGGGRGGFGGFGGFGGAGRGGAAAEAPGGRSVKVTASADDRTNTVVVTAPREVLSAVATIIKQIDSDPTLETAFFVYPLKNANAQNLQSVLNGLFGNSSGSSSSNNTNRTTTGFQPLGSTASGVGGGGGGRGGGGGLGGSTLGSTNRGSTGVSNRTGGTSGSTSSAGNDLAGQAFVVAEPDTNSLLVTAKSSYAEKVKELIRQLDRDVPQVLIKVLVCEVTHTNGSDIGVEYNFTNQRQIPTLNADGTPGTTVGGLSSGSNFGIGKAVDAVLANGSAGGLVANVVESNMSATLRALATQGKLDVLSRPSILASDNQLASIMVGQLVPIITSSNITSVGNIVNSVTYQQVGIILNVTPHINPDGLVVLDVAPTISQLSAQTVTVQAGVNVPVIEQRQAQSRVEIRNGQTIIIGGLMQDQKTETINKIPLLGDIPWIGPLLFSHVVQSKTKTELLIFLTPQVAQNPDLLPGMSNDERAATQLVPNAVAPGTFDEHMQGMSRGAAKVRPNENSFPIIPAHPSTMPALPAGPMHSTTGAPQPGPIEIAPAGPPEPAPAPMAPGE